MINQNIEYKNTFLTNHGNSEQNPEVRLEDYTNFLMNGQIVQVMQPAEPLQWQQQQQQQQVQQQQQSQQQTFVVQADVMQYNQEDNNDYHQDQQQQQQHEFMEICDYLVVANTIVSPDIDAPENVISTQELLENTLNAESQPIEGDCNFAYLSQLNSSNLLQVSQPNIVQDMFKDAFSKQPDLNVLPTLEEHDHNGYNFDVNVSKKNGKSGWTYSEMKKKLYIKINEIVNVDVKFNFQLPVQGYRIRAFLSFAQNVSEPVLRCQNHISKDTETDSVKRVSLLRCENPTAEHCGSTDGKSIKDRLSVLVPVSVCVMPNDKDIKQTIALRFACQNSCIGRKETCVVFLLEGMSGEILAQRTLNVRICSCPKRDKDLDEKNVGGVKRKSEDGGYSRGEKILKRDSVSPLLEIKEEDSCSSDYDLISKQFDFQETASGGCRLVMELPNKKVGLSVLEFAYCKLCADVYAGSSKESALSKSSFQKLKRLYDHAKKICQTTSDSNNSN